jgi:hypothetical protein
MTERRRRRPRLQRAAVALAVVITALAPAGCQSSTSPTTPGEVVIDFSTSAAGWAAGFADYRAGEEAFMELDSGHRAVPAPVGPGRSGHFLSGNNHTDDLFMFIKGRLTGLSPGRTYRVRFAVEIATDVPADCGGVGGSPGQSVFLKAGASDVEPRAIADASGFLQMNVDKGVQANPGAAALVLGTIEGTRPCAGGQRIWELKTFDDPSTGSLTVRADGSGALWVFTGTDSAFEATTSIYITRVAVRFE